MEWVEQNPLTGARVETDGSGATASAAELDAMGVEVGTADPNLSSGGGTLRDNLPAKEVQFFGGELSGGGSGNCVVDGMSGDCSTVIGLLASGAAVVAPEQTVRAVYDRNGQGHLEIFGVNPNSGQYGYIRFTQTSFTSTPTDENGNVDGESETTVFGLQAYYLPRGTGGDAVFFNTGFAAPPQIAPRGYASNRKLSDSECDKRLEQIFGAPGAVVGSTRDPLTLAKFATNLAYYASTGQSVPPGFGVRSPGHSPAPTTPAPGYPEDAGGIFHIYGNAQGTAADTGLYAPSGGTVGRIVTTPKSNAQLRISYNTGLSITFVHLTTASGNPNAMGSIRKVLPKSKTKIRSI